MKQKRLWIDKVALAVFEAAFWEWSQYNPRADAWTRDQAAMAIRQDLGLI